MTTVNEKTVALVSELLLKSADALTTARLGLEDGRIDLADVVRGLDPVAEAISRLGIVATGGSVESIGDDPEVLLQDVVEAIHAV